MQIMRNSERNEETEGIRDEEGGEARLAKYISRPT